jgi:hypothetical protein
MIKKILLFPFKLLWICIKGLFGEIFNSAKTSQNNGGSGSFHT